MQIMAAETKQISATIDIGIANEVAELAEKEDRTFSKMIELLLKQALLVYPLDKKKFEKLIK